MVSVVITVGDELLLGRTVDTNAAWLGARLADLGAPVIRGLRAPDEDGAIAEALDEALSRAPLVVVTGGLGPTDDDRTRPAVAAQLGRALELDSDLIHGLEARFRDLGMDRLPENNRRQAMVPRGATVLANPAGSAPGLAIPGPGNALVVLLPGPPRELRAVFPAAEKQIRSRFGPDLRPVHVRTLHTTGIAESVLAARVEEALGEGREVEAAFLPDLTGVDVRLTVRGAPDEDDAERRLSRAEEVLADVVTGYRFEAPETGDLVEALSRALSDRHWTIAVAESCTGGLVARRLTELGGASRYFEGGVVAYADRVKTEVLGVPLPLLREHGAVSGPVAGALAEGAARLLGAHCGIGVTGVAGPTGGTPEKPVGTVWFAVHVPGQTRTVRRRFVGDRAAIRIRAAQAALHLALTTVLAHPSGVDPPRADPSGAGA